MDGPAERRAASLLAGQDQFVRRRRSHGEPGETFLRELGAVVEECEQRWGIRVERCFPKLSISFVAEAVRADGTAAAIYGEYPPLVNACRKPGEWQSYDIIWIAPRFDGDKLKTPAYCTVIHNGIVVQYHRELIGPTSHRKVVEWQAHPPTGSLRLQDHNNPMRFRNIWVRDLRGWNTTEV